MKPSASNNMSLLWKLNNKIQRILLPPLFPPKSFLKVCRRGPLWSRWCDDGCLHSSQTLSNAPLCLLYTATNLLLDFPVVTTFYCHLISYINFNLCNIFGNLIHEQLPRAAKYNFLSLSCIQTANIAPKNLWQNLFSKIRSSFGPLASKCQ